MRIEGENQFGKKKRKKEMKKEKKKKEKKKRKEENIVWTLCGIESSQVTPVCTHRLMDVFQTKLPFDINEL